MVYKKTFSPITSKIFGKTKYKNTEFYIHLYAIFLKSYLVKMKLLDYKIFHVGILGIKIKNPRTTIQSFSELEVSIEKNSLPQ